ARLLADRVQILGLHQVLQRGVLRAHLGLGLDPLGLALDGGLGVAHLEAQQLPPVGGGGCRSPRVAGPAGAHAATAAYSARNTRSIEGTRSAGETSAPIASLTVVTPASEIPQGTMCRKPASELSQLTAKPCMVTPFSTRTPMAAT